MYGQMSCLLSAICPKSVLHVSAWQQSIIYPLPHDFYELLQRCIRLLFRKRHTQQPFPVFSIAPNHSKVQIYKGFSFVLHLQRCKQFCILCLQVLQRCIIRFKPWKAGHSAFLALSNKCKSLHNADIPIFPHSFLHPQVLQRCTI